MELLAAVMLVCDSHLYVTALPHVASSINAFLLSGGSLWTLESAAERGFLRLMDCLLKRERSDFDRQQYEIRLCRGVNKAIQHGHDVQVLEWWLKSYLPDQDTFPMAHVYRLAIQHANLPALEWVYQETKGELPRIEHLVYSFSPETVIWLLDHGDQHSCTWLSLCKLLEFDTTNLTAIKRCLIHEDENSAFAVFSAERAINEALAYGQVEDLQWFYEHRPALFGPNLLRNAVRFGNLEAAKWLVKMFPPHFFNNPTRTFVQRFDDLRPYIFNFDMVKWILCEFVWRKERNRNDWMRDACDFAARSGKLEMLEFVYKIRMQRFKTENAVSHALRKWAKASPPIMDEAAANGHLGVLEFFQRHQSQRCTSAAMDNAAANGNMEVVQWLHQNRSEGCTKKAMDAAAAGGHLELVQWLHENRSEAPLKR